MLMLAAAAAALAVAPTSSPASPLLDRWTSDESLRALPGGVLVVSWRVGGLRRSAVVTGGHVSYAHVPKGRSVGREVAPDVPLAITEQVLPDGTHAALQRVRRVGQYGRFGASELRVSRWSGGPTRLRLTGEWGYAGRFPRVCGTATFHGRPFYGGPHTRSGSPLDSFGRNVYIDVLRDGSWWRIFGVLTRPRGYALLIRKPQWRGTRTGRLSSARTSTATSPPTPSPTRRCPTGPPAASARSPRSSTRASDAGARRSLSRR